MPACQQTQLLDTVDKRCSIHVQECKQDLCFAWLRKNTRERRQKWAPSQIWEKMSRSLTREREEVQPASLFNGDIHTKQPVQKTSVANSTSSSQQIIGTGSSLAFTRLQRPKCQCNQRLMFSVHCCWTLGVKPQALKHNKVFSEFHPLDIWNRYIQWKLHENTT